MAFDRHWKPSSEALRAAAWILVGFYILGFAVSAASRSQSDFVIYRNAGAAALQKKPIYGLHDPSPFQYAPIYAVAFIPLGLLPPRAAQLLWFSISMALALPMMILGTGRLPFGPAFKLGWELILVPLLLCIRFIHPNFDHGQINLLLLAMVVWGFAFAIESKPVAAGGLLAASMLAKPFALPVILYLLARRQFACIVSMMIFLAALVVIPGVLVGPNYALHQTGEYLTSLTTRGIQRSQDLKNKYNQSSAAIAVRFFAPRSAKLSNLKVAAVGGFAFQCVLTLGVIAWLVFP